MASKEPDENEKEKNGDSVFHSLAGIAVFGMICCIAGPLVILAGVGGITAWFNGLNPFVIGLFTLVAGVLAVVWVTRRSSRRKLGKVNRRDSSAPDKT